MRRVREGAIAASLLLGLATAHAQLNLDFEAPVFGHTSFSATSTSILRYRGNNYDANLYDDDFFSLYDRLDMALQSEQVRFETRTDVFVPFTIFDAPRCPLGAADPRCYLAWDVRPERFTLRWEPPEWTIEAGDSQIVFGRGMALSFRKVDLLGVDTALRGGHVRWQGTNVRFGLHGGIANPQNQDPIDLRIIREQDDIVGGGSFGFTVPGSTPVSVGVHALHVHFQDDASSTYTGRAVDVAGSSLEMPSLAGGALALSVEANGMRRSFSLFDQGRVQGGRAVYASAQIQTSNLTVLFEWKDYQNYLVAPSATEANAWRIYSASPPVELTGPQRLRGIGNQRGGGVKLDYAFLPGPWSFTLASVLYGFNEEPLLDPWSGALVTHSWATLARRQEYGESVNWSLNATGGARFEVLLHDIPSASTVAGQLDRWMVHGQLEVTAGSGDHSFDFVVDHRHERELIGGSVHDFQIGGASVTYTFGVPLALTLALRWTDFQQGVVQRRAMVDYNFLGGEFYPSFEGRWTFEPGTFLNLFVGQTPGGQICSGGVCRDVPTFEGIRLTFVGRL
ncbi:MAG: hypothetical protein IT378_09150 [Sandaracinaceae bacterium]|nr:hypothetical protein [Sandaracinaceae bacterium]